MLFFYSILVILAVFFLGACLGSFFNVVLYRQARGEDWVIQRSKCESCSTKIAWYDNIPIVSWLVLRGRCRHCQASISYIHPVMEFLMGTLFVWWVVMGSWFFQLTQAPLVMIQPAFWLIVGILLIVLVIIDWQDQIIPDWLNLTLLILTLAYRLILCVNGAMQWEDFGWAIVAALGFGLIFLFVHYLAIWIYHQDGFGLGDVKFIVIMGVILGWPKILIALLIAFAVGSLVGVFLMVTGRARRKTALPFGPFLVLGTVLALVWGQPIWWGLMNFLAIS